MFGIKKSFTVSNDSSKNLDNQNISNSGGNSKFFYYVDTEEFISQLEIYIKPNNYPGKKVVIMTKSEVDFKELNTQIKESFKLLPDFKNVSGIRAENLYKILNEKKMYLPKTGCINEYLKSGDIIYCDIISDEFWVKTYFKIQSYKYKKFVQSEYKIQKKMKFKQLKLILLKAGIEIFLDELKKNNTDILLNSFNYFVKNIKFHNKKNKKSNGIDEKKKSKIKYIDNKNEILINLKFGIFEQLIHEQLITMDLKKNEANYYRFNEYCNLNFEELSSSKRFEPEFNTIQDISREFLTSQYNDINTPFLFYNLKKSNEVVSEYMYNMINLPNDNEFDFEDEEDDDEEFGEYTSFGKFYSEDASKFFGNITSIKKKKNKINKNKYDSNMIILAPFLFKLTNSNKPGPSSRDIRNPKIFSTFAYQNQGNNQTNRLNTDLNNFFLGPLSLEAGNILLKDDSINDNNINDNNLKFNKEDENLKDIFLIDDESIKKPKDRNTMKYNDMQSIKSKGSIISLMRLSKQSNCCNDLYNFFSQIEFLENLKIKFKYYISKKVLEKIVIPESRNFENIDNDFLKFLKKKENEEENASIVRVKKLVLFLVIFFIYYLLMIVTTNYEIINLFIRNYK